MKFTKFIRDSRLISASCLFLGAISLNYAATANTNTNQQQSMRFNNSKALVISKPGHTFEIKVPANPTTGYLWFLKSYNHNLIEAVKHRYDAPKTNMVGSPGKDVWTFKAKPAFLRSHKLQ
ncbi:protease inhibitor I42 family protein [Piscirickettsia litoralis]|uniref:protease inhibitor I42 family protein n=1 Tax=Piscirickettsia litoralis TaxID=1891921 RepID=UPI001F2431CE|nr:protease inhibitor I42 family protein [Piscirickettsia litoralis]